MRIHREALIRAVLVLFALRSWAGPALADDNSEANTLFVEAMLAWDQAAAASDDAERLRLLQSVDANLQQIITAHPGADLAVKLVIGIWHRSAFGSGGPGGPDRGRGCRSRGTGLDRLHRRPEPALHHGRGGPPKSVRSRGADRLRHNQQCNSDRGGIRTIRHCTRHDIRTPRIVSGSGP